MPTWPVGVETVSIVFGKGITPGGNMTEETLVVTPLFTGTNGVIWAATGVPMLPFSEFSEATEGATGVVQLPVVDQAGWVDDGGNAYSMWAYRLEATPRFRGSQGRPRVKYVQPLSGQTEIDFDRIPDGAVGLPSSAPVVPVTSVNGQTGPVTLDAEALGALTPAEANAAYLPIDGDKPVGIVVAREDKNAANFEQTSSSAAALRIRQSGSGPIGKWRSGSTDVGFIENKGDLRLLPLSNGRALQVGGASWAAGRGFGFGNKDGLFFVSSFADASGIPTTGGVYQSYTKLFGAANVTKTGDGNLDAFWASISHSGPDEVGLFIGDVTGTAGGNLWGGHNRLTANTVESVMIGQSLEMINNAPGTTKAKRGLHVRSGGSENVTVGILLDTVPGAAGTFTDFITGRGVANEVKFNITSAGAMSLAGGLTAGGAVSAVGSVTATTSTDGAQVFRMNTDRPWAFRQVGTAGSTALRLSPDADAKVFRITSPNGNRALETTVADTAANAEMKLLVDGGKFSVFGAAAVAKQTGLPAAATDLATAISLVNFLRTALTNYGLVATT